MRQSAGVILDIFSLSWFLSNISIAFLHFLFVHYDLRGSRLLGVLE